MKGRGTPMERVNPTGIAFLIPSVKSKAEQLPTSCDHYDHYKEDIAILKRLNQKSYRFSTHGHNPARGAGPVNQRASTFYSRLKLICQRQHVTLCARLAHWDV